MNQLNQLLSRSTYFYELNRLNHLYGIYHILLGYTSYGKALCKKALQILEHFDNQPNLQNHKEELKEFFGESFDIND